MNVYVLVVFYTRLNKIIFCLSNDIQTQIYLEDTCKFGKTHAKFPLLFYQAYSVLIWSAEILKRPWFAPPATTTTTTKNDDDARVNNDINVNTKMTRSTRNGTSRQADVAAGNIRKAAAARNLKKRTDLAKRKKSIAKVSQKKASPAKKAQPAKQVRPPKQKSPNKTPSRKKGPSTGIQKTPRNRPAAAAGASIAAGLAISAAEAAAQELKDNPSGKYVLRVCRRN
jgi:hypothetical protein